jgi:S-adenosylmethionine-dependent methyltransferase
LTGSQGVKYLVNPVENHYDKNAEGEWERLLRHRTEFGVTLKALTQHLPAPPATVLDIGGGPGRYAIALSQRGYTVTLLDLAQSNLALAREKAAEAGLTFAEVVQGNALALPDLVSAPFDVVLLLGPLYHLLKEAERKTAVSQAAQVLKPGGVIFAAFITRWAGFRDMAAKGRLDWLTENPDRAAMLLQTGKNLAVPGSLFPNSYFAHPDEVLPLLESQGFETEALLGCEGVVAGHEMYVNELEGDLWQQWLDLNYRLGHEPFLFGASDHLLYVGRKVD